MEYSFLYLLVSLIDALNKYNRCVKYNAVTEKVINEMDETLVELNTLRFICKKMLNRMDENGINYKMN